MAGRGMMMVRINGIRLDDSAHVAVIAELSGNHGQSYAQAERLVAAAAESGAQFAKVQTFTAEEICADVPILFGYDAAHDAWCERQGVTRLRQLMSKGGLPRAWHVPLKRFAESCGIQLLSTPFSVDAARFLVEEVGVGGLKIASGDLTFEPLLEFAASTGLPILLSTGGATLPEIRTALLLMPDSPVVVMHCASIYPCPLDAINVSVITTLRERLDEAVGFSDHTLSEDIVPVMAVALGATVYEKHLRLEEDETSVDVAHSLTPNLFAQMVYNIRQASLTLGDGLKQPHALEMHDRIWARRSSTDWLRPTEDARAGRWA